MRFLLHPLPNPRESRHFHALGAVSEKLAFLIRVYLCASVVSTDSHSQPILRNAVTAVRAFLIRVYLCESVVPPQICVHPRPSAVPCLRRITERTHPHSSFPPGTSSGLVTHASGFSSGLGRRFSSIIAICPASWNSIRDSITHARYSSGPPFRYGGGDTGMKSVGNRSSADSSFRTKHSSCTMFHAIGDERSILN